MNKKYIEKIRKQISDKFANCKRTDRPRDILNDEQWEVYSLQFKGGPDRTYSADWLTKNRWPVQLKSLHSYLSWNKNDSTSQYITQPFSKSGLTSLPKNALISSSKLMNGRHLGPCCLSNNMEDSLHDQYTVTCEEFYPEDLYGMVRAEDQEDPKEGPQP